MYTNVCVPACQNLLSHSQGKNSCFFLCRDVINSFTFIVGALGKKLFLFACINHRDSSPESGGQEIDENLYLVVSKEAR